MTKPPFFTAAWNVPSADFDKWIARGVNTLIGCGIPNPPGDTPQHRYDWALAALNKGLWTVYDPQGMAVLENFLYALMPDEMDGREWPVGSGHWDGLPHDQIKPYYDAFKARGFTVLQNMKVTQNPGRLAYYQSIADCSDLWSSDGYPRSNNADRYNEALWPGQSTSTLKQAGPTKSVWSIIESGWQHLKDTPHGRAPTAVEVNAAFDAALASGATGICIFSHYFNGNGGWAGWDNTAADVAAVITDRFKKLTAPPEPGPIPPDSTDARLKALEADMKELKDWRAKNFTF